MTRALVCVLLALVVVPGALASEENPGSLEVQQELYCTDCDTTLAEASAVSYTPGGDQLHRGPHRRGRHEERDQERRSPRGTWAT